MAVEIKFLDAFCPRSTSLITDKRLSYNDTLVIRISIENNVSGNSILLDKTTAIKLKKQLGTLINQITLEEAKNA